MQEFEVPKFITEYIVCSNGAAQGSQLRLKIREIRKLCEIKKLSPIGEVDGDREGSSL